MRAARRTVIANLSLAYGEKLTARQRRKLTRGVFVSLGRGLFELINLLGSGTSPLAMVAEFEGEEHLRAALAKGKGCLVLTAHLGNWQLLPLFLTAHGYRGTAVARELYYPPLSKLYWQRTRDKGLALLERKGSMLQTMRVLKENQILGLVVDQDTQVESVFVDFFGHAAKTPAGPAKLSYASGAPIVPIFITRRQDGRHRVVAEPELALAGKRNDESKLLADVALYNEVIERHVRANPDQWVWIHERWRSRPE